MTKTIIKPTVQNCGTMRWVDKPESQPDPFGKPVQVIQVCVAAAGHSGDHTWNFPQESN